MMDNKQNNIVHNNPEGTALPSTNMQLLVRPDIQTLFIDKFIFTKRPDGTLITSGIQGVPGLEIEQLRFLMTEDHAKRFLDSLAKLLDYYPVKNKEAAPEALAKLNTTIPASKKNTVAKQTKPVAKKKQKSK